MLKSPFDEDPLQPSFIIGKYNSKTEVHRGIHYLLIFALKQRLWVLVRTVSIRRF